MNHTGASTLLLGDNTVDLHFVGHLNLGEVISMMYWIEGFGTSPYYFFSNAEGQNKIEMLLLHADSANTIVGTGSYSNAASSPDVSALLATTASLTTRVSSLESQTSSLLNANVNFTLGVLGGSDISTQSSDYAETTRNSVFAPRTSPNFTVPAGGSGPYFISAVGRVTNLDPLDYYWALIVRMTRGNVVSNLCRSVSDAPPAVMGGLSKGDNSRSCSFSGPLQAGDLVQIAYLVSSSGKECTQFEFEFSCGIYMRLSHNTCVTVACIVVLF